MHQISALILAASLAACGGLSSLYCDEETPCRDPDRPFCDLEGEFPESEGHGRTCIADPGEQPPCEANESVCLADTAFVCDASGALESQTSCPLGCHDTEPRCNRLDPSNGLAAHLDDAANAPDVILGDGATINTSTGEVRNGDGTIVDVDSVLLPAPTDGVEVRVFKFKSLVIGDAVVMTTDGATGPAAAFVVAGGVELRGTVNVTPLVGTANNTQCQVVGHPAGSTTTAGVGGSGFGGVGGAGGAGDDGTTLDGGPINGNMLLTPLRGGCSNINACAGLQCRLCDASDAPIPAKGGGALQISSNGIIQIGVEGFRGELTAHGEGGQHRGCGGTGLGGASGGAILLEAGVVELGPASAMAANGSGGTCANSIAGDGATDGQPNGAECPGSEGDGGDGGTGTRPAGGGGADTGSGVAGGGGGGVGRVRLNTRNATLAGDEAAISPRATLGAAATR